MSSKSEDDDDDPVMRSSTERYDRAGTNLDWFIILASASSIFFGFLLNIAVDPPSYFTFFDNIILLAALYAVTIATTMFILPVIFHASHYRKLDVERFLLRNKQYVLIGIFCVTLAMYLGLDWLWIPSCQVRLHIVYLPCLSSLFALNSSDICMTSKSSLDYHSFSYKTIIRR